MQFTALERAHEELAQLLWQDFGTSEVLERVCHLTLGVLDAAAVAVSLRNEHGLHVTWRGDPALGEIEGLQRDLEEGPCLDVLTESRMLHTRPDVETDRWPRYAAAVVGLGVTDILTYPLGPAGHALGALDVYSTAGGGFDDAQVGAGHTLATAAAGCLRTARDREQWRVDMDHLRLQALHDPLTGLPNRFLFTDRLQQALSRLARDECTVGVLYIDLDGFKALNDTHGHGVGDRALVVIARRLHSVLRPTDTLARLGGDEFVVLCEDPTDLRGAKPSTAGGPQGPSAAFTTVAERLLRTLDVPMRFGGAEFTTSASIGIAQPASGDTIDGILRDADMAMYAAKRKGGGAVVSDQRTVSRHIHHAQVTTDLYTALDRGELRVAYQPVVRLGDGGVPPHAAPPQGVEALLRWAHPTRGLLPAEAFLPQLEHAGMMTPVGQWVLRHVCDHLPSLRPDVTDADGWYVAVNVSGLQLREPGFVADVAALLTETGADPANLMVEVTETALASRDAQSVAALQDLAALGLRVAIDDFGTGYSSLADLRHLPIDVLKLDRLFIEGLGSDRRSEALVRGTISLAHELDLLVVAEGVEHLRQHELLIAAACDSAQGYLYGYPLPV